MNHLERLKYFEEFLGYLAKAFISSVTAFKMSLKVNIDACGAVTCTADDLKQQRYLRCRDRLSDRPIKYTFTAKRSRYVVGYRWYLL